MSAPTYLLDTSVYSQPLKPGPSPAVAARTQALGERALAVSCICEAEVLYGIRRKQSPNLERKYDELLRDRYRVLPVNSEIAEAYADLRAACEKRGAPVGNMDLLIAATAKVHNLIVATLNAKDFAKIPDLRFEDWSQPPASDN